MQAQETIISITETKDGYSLTFSNGHSIFIRNGQNGADGQDGATGQTGADGLVPVIGIAQDTDGVYYWTLNGVWLYDKSDNKIPVNGANSNDGETGANGIIPQFKIEDGDWYISTDNSATWQYLGQATANKGEQGDKGDKGEQSEQGETGDKGETGDTGAAGRDGVSLFLSVTYDSDYVNITLADGTILTLPRTTNNTITITFDPNGGEGKISPITLTPCVCVTLPFAEYDKLDELHCHLIPVSWNTKADGTGLTYPFYSVCTFSQNITLYAQYEQALFSISSTQKVRISPGNLQYQASTDTWRFAPEQYHYCGYNNLYKSATYDGWIDLFGWGTSGYHDPADLYNTHYLPYETDTAKTGSRYNPHGFGPSTNMPDPNLIGSSANYDWGIYNRIDDHPAGTWRTPTFHEMIYFMGPTRSCDDAGHDWIDTCHMRPNAQDLRCIVIIDSIYGILVLPDNWQPALDIEISRRRYTLEQWQRLERRGAIFLPATGYVVSKDSIARVNNASCYISSTAFNRGAIAGSSGTGTCHCTRRFCFPVRLIENK